MHGSGFIELLAREMTADLKAIRDTIPPGGSMPLITKGVSFGSLSRASNGARNTSSVTGLPAPSLASRRLGESSQPHPSAISPGRGCHLASPVHGQRV